jgi:hypothetical protein
MKQVSYLLKAALLCSLACVIGCATTQQASRDDVGVSGFLRDYSQLKPGKSDEALLSYRNPKARWANYNKVMIDRVAVYTSRNSDLKSDASKQDQYALATYFSAALNESLGQKFKIANYPGPDVLRIRTALTDADQSEVLLDTITTTPIGLALSAIKRGATGADSFVGFAQAEVEILDSLSSERLAAAVDKRYGTKALRSKFGSWNHAKSAMDYWAEAITNRLVELKSGNE